MITRYSKLIPAVLVVLSLIIGGWTASPSAVQQAGYTPPIPGAQAILTRLSSFSVDPAQVSSTNISGFDRAFLENAMIMNTAEMTMMQDALNRTANTEIKGLTQLMMQMHTTDMNQMNSLRAKFATAPLPGIDAAPVLPDTTFAVWGLTTLNLKSLYVDKVTAAPAPFEVTYLNAMIDLHAMGVEAAVVGLNESQNPQIKAVAQHLLEELNIHKLLMVELRDRVFYHLTTPIDLTVPTGPTPSPMPTTGATTVPTSVPPTATPTKMATSIPTLVPTKVATMTPTTAPTKVATLTPTKPVIIATFLPTLLPTLSPSPTPTFKPIIIATFLPTLAPTKVFKPSPMPTLKPTIKPK